MNITPHTVSLPLATVVNPPTEGLRRDNHQREIITQVTATNPSAAEKGVASEKERARTPAQNNEQIDFANLKKQAEHAANTISEQKGQQDGQQHSDHHEEQKNSQNNAEDASAEKEHQQELVDEKVILELKQRDQEVRAHELAHARTGGAVTGAPSYTFKAGPDGKKYAVAGEVSVDLSGVPGNPQATIAKMQKVHAAALAPANPSAQDIKVASSATQKILAAQSEILSQQNQQSTQASGLNSDEKTKTTLNQEKEYDSSNDFDTLMNQTLAAQDEIISAITQENSNTSQKLASTYNQNSSQSIEVQQRSQRIESYYFKVSQGYEKPDNFQFELTA